MSSVQCILNLRASDLHFFVQFSLELLLAGASFWDTRFKYEMYHNFTLMHLPNPTNQLQGREKRLANVAKLQPGRARQKS